MRERNANSSDPNATEGGARASVVWRRSGLIRVLHAAVRLLLLFLPSPRPTQDSRSRPGSILVVEYWNLGDLAMLVPFLRNLRRSFPRAQISLLVNPRFKTFLEGQGIVDEFIPVRVPWAQHFDRCRKYNPFSFSWIRLARTLLALRRRHFDWAFSGRMDIRDNLLLWLSGARRRIAYDVGGGDLLTDRVLPDPLHPHRTDNWLKLLVAVQEPADPGLGGFRMTDVDFASARSFLADLGIPSGAFLVGVHPGARIATRRWGEDRFSEVVRQILSKSSAHVLWFSEPGTPCQVPPFERCHEVSLDLRPFLAVLSHCRLLLCNDSGPMHLANLLEVPVVAVFGPQRPQWFGPRGQRDRVVIRPEFRCRPCFDYCIFEQPYCLRTISTDEVYDAVQTVLRSAVDGKSRRVGLVN
jgi:heptosyltransferase II